MAYVFTNPNPESLFVGDCVVRALSIATEHDWEDVYLGVCLQGGIMYDMPSSNRVWNQYLKDLGYLRHIISDFCPSCYTIKDFCTDHPEGTYVVSTGTHVVAVKNGDYLDTWDSGNESIIYYWTKEE